MQEQVILVDENDTALGFAEKLEAHQAGGRLHRAFSIFVFNAQQELLLQRRALGKYHFGGLWTNTCCSHPRPGETTPAAAQRRLMEELGFSTPLAPCGTFLYRAEDARTGLTEHELDHVFWGHYHGSPDPNPDEVMDWRWQPLEGVVRELAAFPERFTPWFPLALAYVKERTGDLPNPSA